MRQSLLSTCIFGTYEDSRARLCAESIDLARNSGSSHQSRFGIQVLSTQRSQPSQNFHLTKTPEFPRIVYLQIRNWAAIAGRTELYPRHWLRNGLE